MGTAARAIVFDVDGVLVDSLPQHLQICKDKAAEYGLASVSVPDAPAFRRMITAGVRVSPMLDFFLAVGFPADQAERAVGDYEREFMVRYRPRPFPGIDRMLESLRDAGFSLGLVTSNTRTNVAPALGAAMRHFDDRCLFYYDSSPVPRSKASWLAEATALFGVRPEECLYVGDQPADAEAARQAQVPFVGVTYGWGLTRESSGLVLADTLDHLSAILVGRRAAS